MNHDHHHDRGPGQPPDEHTHRNVESVEEPLDAANQSLADALRSSFSVLKVIMAVVVVLFLFSNVRTIGTHEQALVLRLGRLKDVRPPGLVSAFPFPIDEIVPLPTRKSNELVIESHTFYRRANEIGKPLSFISRSPAEGLNPSLDGALLTSDAGLVHARWKVTYKFEDVAAFVSQVAGDRVESAEDLIRVMVETAGIEVASEMTAEEMIRTKVDLVQSEMRRRVNEQLAALGTGLNVSLIEMFEPTPPLQVRGAFDATQSAENIKQQRIRGAEKDRTRILNAAAGAAHRKLILLVDELDRAKAQGEQTREIYVEIDRVLADEVEGEAGERIKGAGAYRATVVSQMQSDVEQYRTLIPEYQRNPMMLITRLWEETKQSLFESAGVTKIYRPPGLREFRIKIPLDPEQRRIEEAKRLQNEGSARSPFRTTRIVPVGPEFD